MKRFLTVLGIILAIGGIVYAGYFLSNRNASRQSATEGALPPPAGSLPEATTTKPDGTTTAPLESTGVSGAVAGLSLVSSEKFSAFAVATTGVVFGVSPDGKVFSVDQKGVSSPISSAPIDGFSDGAFSSDARKLLASWGDSENRQFSVFDTGTKSWQPLPLGTVSAAWKPNSHALAYIQEKNGVKNLLSWDTDRPKNKPVSLLQLYVEDMSVAYPSPDKIILSGKSSGLVRSSLLSYDLKKKNLSPLISEVYGLSAKWNSAGTESLVFFGNTNGAGGSIRLVADSGKTINQLQFLTLPEKCLFSADIFAAPAPTSTKAVLLPPLENFLYCAIPRDQKALSQNLLPDNYGRGALFTADGVYRINTENGFISSLFDDQSKRLDASKPAIYGSVFFFINRYDRNLYALPIPK